MNSIHIPNRLVKMRGALGMTQKQLGKKIGRSHNTIMNWEKGNTPFPKELASVFGDLLNVNPSWLLSGAGEMFVEPLDRDLATVAVEVLTLAGLGDLYDLQNREPIEVVQLTKDLVINVGREPRTAIRCRGDSMYPTIVDGALVGIDFNDREPVDNGLFLLRFRDVGLTIKRLRFKIDGYLIVADNPTIEDELVSRDHLEEGLIVGRARWIYNKV